MNRLFSFLLFLCFLSLTAKANRPTEWSLNLDSSLSAVYFPEGYGAETNKNLLKLELNPSYRWKYLESWRIYSVQFGNTLHNWGVTDGYNPLDTLNAKQYFDPLHSRKLGALSLIFSQSLDSWDYEVILIPKNSEARLPGTRSRWLPREIFIPQTTNNDQVLLLPQNLQYHYIARQNLDHALDNNLALRFQRHGSVFDMAVSYYEGVASFPLVQPEVSGTITQVSPKTVISVDPDVFLHTKNYRIRQGGFSMVSSQFDFLFKYATTYSQSFGKDPTLDTDPPLPGWTHESVLGFEKTFNVGSEGLLVAILQHSFINSQRENDSNLSMLEVFRRGWMLGGKMSWKEVWNFSLLGLYDGARGSHYEEIGVSRRILDRWVAQATVNFIQGPADTALGVYNKNDFYTFSVSRSF